jgi:hypothetical protein
MKSRRVRPHHNPLVVLGGILLAALIALVACSAGGSKPEAGQPSGGGNTLAQPPALVQTLNDPTPEQPVPAGPPATSGASTVDPAACSAKGGEIRPVCLLGRPMCVAPYADAGKSCSDSDDCQGRCKADPAGGSAPGKKANGVCEANNDPCGCFGLVEDGVIQPTLCVD